MGDKASGAISRGKIEYGDGGARAHGGQFAPAASCRRICDAATTLLKTCRRTGKQAGRQAGRLSKSSDSVSVCPRVCLVVIGERKTFGECQERIKSEVDATACDESTSELDLRP